MGRGRRPEKGVRSRRGCGDGVGASSTGAMKAKCGHILVVEDDRKIARLVRAYLEEAGFSVYVAYDGFLLGSIGLW